MTRLPDITWLMLAAGVLVVLLVASAAGWILHRRVGDGAGRGTVDNINARIRAWWVMAAVFVAATGMGVGASVLLFTVVSFLALREFVTLTPTKPADHRALVWSFFVVTPLQYALIGFGWYGLFSVLIPVYAAIFLAIRIVLEGDTERFIERAAAIQWGLVICVYFVSYGPALLTLRIPRYDHRDASLLLFLVLVVEMSDVLQFVWGKTLGRTPLAASVSPHKTWEGLIGGVVCASAIGTALWWATPFSPVVAAAMAFAVTVAGATGGLIMSAIKRDRGVKDYGALISGHGGILDRIDSLCFAAPVFFHLTRFFYAR
jgi:phosphatidate cytidylyltransferase